MEQSADLELRKAFRSVLDHADDILWVRERGAQGRILEANRAAEQFFGVDRGGLIGRTISEMLYNPADIDVLRRLESEASERGVATAILPFRQKRAGILELELKMTPIQAGGAAAVLVVARPIRHEQEKLRRALALYEAFRRSNDVMFYSDRNGIILDVNDAFVRQYGFTREEAVGNRPAILRSKHSSNELYKRMWGDILDPAKGFWRGEIINRAKDGREVPLILTITAVRDEAGLVLGYVSNAVDLTERYSLQQRVAQSEALATIGEMAAVVAHEIRNPLGSIVMAARQVAAGDLDAEEKDLVLRVLRTESGRLNETLTNFLSFARPRELRIEPGDLNRLVEEVVGAVSGDAALLGAAKLETRLDDGLRPVPMDAAQLRQVVWNVLINALQAVDGKGAVAVRTGQAQGQAFVSVSDTGPGVPPDVLGSIFKPFRTTKQQGTGLGLAIAERIVSAHGGRIAVDSRPGSGATFTIYLPSAEN